MVEVYAITGVTLNHAQIIGNFFAALHLVGI
jgi:hypothetical protein